MLPLVVMVPVAYVEVKNEVREKMFCSCLLRESEWREWRVEHQTTTRQSNGWEVNGDYFLAPAASAGEGTSATTQDIRTWRYEVKEASAPALVCNLPSHVPSAVPRSLSLSLTQCLTPFTIRLFVYPNLLLLLLPSSSSSSLRPDPHGWCWAQCITCTCHPSIYCQSKSQLVVEMRWFEYVTICSEQNEEWCKPDAWTPFSIIFTCFRLIHSLLVT